VGAGRLLVAAEALKELRQGEVAGQVRITYGQPELDLEELGFGFTGVGRVQRPGVSDWNTDDAWGLSRINFDGWRYVGIPLPGNYPGEHYPWPANSQWRWDGDGVVHYPLTLRKLIVVLPEKVLHLRAWAPPPRREIYLGELFAGQGDTAKIKASVAE
jgi:hypothetical protein